MKTLLSFLMKIDQTWYAHGGLGALIIGIAVKILRRIDRIELRFNGHQVEYEKAAELPKAGTRRVVA